MSADSEDGDLSALAYPGFVDILSSVIIMFVFFVLVVASALYFHMIIFKSQMLATIQEAAAAVEAKKSESQAQELMIENQSLKKQLEEVTKKMETFVEEETEDRNKLYQERSEFTESQEQKIIMDEAEDSIVVFFGTDSISLTEDSKTQIRSFMENHMAAIGGGKADVQITAGKNSQSITDTAARKLALARMLNVRNMFLDSEVPPEAVVPSISGDEEIEGSQNWVKIRILKHE